jgi:hypothetical protein
LNKRVYKLRKYLNPNSKIVNIEKIQNQNMDNNSKINLRFKQDKTDVTKQLKESQSKESDSQTKQNSNNQNLKNENDIAEEKKNKLTTEI